jgi:hypothetical protein
MTTEASRVTWVLVRKPAWGKTAWDAGASCPHGTASYIVFGTPDVVKQNARDLSLPHTLRHGCDCTIGSVTLNGEEEKLG